MSVETSGFDKLYDDLYKLAEAVDDDGELMQKMLDAGAEESGKVWKNAIQTSNHVDSGDMLRSVKTAKDRKNPLKRVIYPQGRDKNGVRNAHKAYILNYGTSTIAGDDFISKTYDEMDSKVYQAELKVYDEELKKRGL